MASSNPREDASAAQSVPVALRAEVVNIGVSDPHNTIALVRNSAAQLDFIAVIGKVMVKSAELLPQTAPNKEGEARNPRHIHKEGFTAVGQQMFCESAYLIVIPGKPLISGQR